MIFDDKRGLMDDVTDLLSLVLILSMISFFAFVVLRTDAGDKADQTIEKIESFRHQQELLYLINSPAVVGTAELSMKDVILTAVNTNDADLFETKMKHYFENNNLEGGVAVYDSVSYGVEEDPEPLLSYNNEFFVGDEKGAVYLDNIDGQGKKKLIVVKLFG
jgi:hypothetical protein